MSTWRKNNLWKLQLQLEANIIIRRCSIIVTSRAQGSCECPWVGLGSACRTETCRIWAIPPSLLLMFSRKRRYTTLQRNSSSRRAALNHCTGHRPAERMKHCCCRAQPKLVRQQRRAPISWARSKRTTLSRDFTAQRPSSDRSRNKSGSTYPAAPQGCQPSLGRRWQGSKSQKLIYLIYQT